MTLRLLVNPLAKGAYFDAYLDVAMSELRAHVPAVDVEAVSVGGMDFLRLPLRDDQLSVVSRLSFVQGGFREAAENTLIPLDLRPDFDLPEGFVYGAKYRGKTHELVTQLALNLALLYYRGEDSPRALLDPMAGRGTTLLWGLRYRLQSRGVEVDPQAREALHAHLKKQTKLHRVSHTAERGSGGARGRNKDGSFIYFTFGERNLRMVTGDAADVSRLLNGQRFELVVADLPYGVEFRQRGESAMERLQRCLPAWAESLRPGGTMVLIFNTYQPRRQELDALMSSAGLFVESFSAPHRMSESIVRDLIVASRPLSS